MLGEILVLIKYLPNQIAAIWSLVEPSIRNTLPPFTYETDKKMNNILRSLLDGRMHLWIVSDSMNKMVAFVLTTFTFDEITEVKNLLIYNFNGNMDAKIHHKLLVRDMNTLKGFAKTNKCHRIIAYSNIPGVLSICKLTRGKVEYAFLTWDLIGEEEMNEDLYEDSNGDRQLESAGRKQLRV